MRKLLLALPAILIGVLPGRLNAQTGAADSAWRSGDTDRAEQLYSQVLASDSSNPVALHRYALTQAWKNKFPVSLHLFDKLIALQPDNIEARIDRARVISWQGDLTGALASIDSVLAKLPDDVGALQLNATIMRWQGRDDRAYELLQHALRVAPTDKDARDQMRLVRATTGPRLAPNFVHESDSDGNEINSWSGRYSWRPRPRWELRPDGYFRSAGATGLTTRSTFGGGVGLWHMLESGWSAQVYGGVARSFVSARAAVSTPGSGAVNATVAYAYGALDATALLIAREVTTSELSASATITPMSGTNIGIGFSTTQFEGHISERTNRRTAGSASITRRLSHAFTVGVSSRAFSFEEDLNDGYFDPDFYGNAELVARYRWEKNKFALNADGAPGVQKVRQDGEVRGSLRGSARATYTVAVGRTLEAFFLYANSGLNQLSQVQSSEYRYSAFGVSFSFVF
ncbi:MAG TPA: tetratricopeptide repeat protein [Longimicrobiales bacterium]|nr:tetratricopeptide repeat protein [Longimicrobiales bacterium]